MKGHLTLLLTLILSHWMLQSPIVTSATPLASSEHTISIAHAHNGQHTTLGVSDPVDE